MAIILTCGSKRLVLPVRDDLEEELLSRAMRQAELRGPAHLGELLSYRLLGGLVECSSQDDKAPSEAQLKYAVDLAEKHGVAIPPSAFHSRLAIGSFISEFANKPGRKGLGKS